MRTNALFLVAAGALALGCNATPRRPLFSFDSSRGKPRGNDPFESPPPALQPQVPATQGRSEPILIAPGAQPLADPSLAVVTSRSAARADIDLLLSNLRAHRGDRRSILDQITGLGDGAQPDIDDAMEEAAFETDVLHEALVRIREAKDKALGVTGIPELGASRKRAVSAPWIEAKYRLALDRFLAGDDFGAQMIIEAILTLEPNATARPKLERLRHQVRDSIIAETIVAVTLVPEDRVLLKEKTLRVKLRLESHSRVPITMRPATGAALGEVTLEYEELRTDGTRTLRRSTQGVPPTGEIVLAPGERRELALDLPVEHGAKPREIVGRYRLYGRLRPYTLLAGVEPLPYFLPIPVLEVLVLDPEDVPAAGKPADSFRQALEVAKTQTGGPELESAARRAFAAALVWSSADRDAAAAGIMAALEPSTGVLEKMLRAALGRATGEPGSFTKEEWLVWWKSGDSRPRGAKPSGGDDDDVPGLPHAPR
jgi:hypothetical protein